MGSRIQFSLVARGTVVLAEFANLQGNIGTIARRILEKLPVADTRATFSQDRHLFHILVQDGLIYVCMAEESFGRRIPFSFLEEVRTRFVGAYGDAAKSALAYAYNTEFARVLCQQMEYFSQNPAADTIDRVRGEINEVRNVMVQNIDRVLERGEKIELLVDKTDHLQNDAFSFRRRSRQLRRAMWWKSVRFACLVATSLLLILYIVLAIFCGLKLKHC